MIILVRELRESRKLGERFLVRNLYESDFGGGGGGKGNVRRGAGSNILTSSTFGKGVILA